MLVKILAISIAINGLLLIGWVYYEYYQGDTLRACLILNGENYG